MGTVEILLAAYNGEAYLAEQLDSILNQDTDAWHMTLSDDGSSDASVRIMEDYARRYPQKIALAHSGTRFGSARDHFFWLMRQCDAEYMLFCDQDDVWHSDKVRLFAQTLEEEEHRHGSQTPLLVFSDVRVVDEQLACLHPSLTQLQRQNPHAGDFRNLLFQNTVTGCAMGINRSLARLAARCGDIRQAVMHDWWLALVAARFGRMVYLDRSTIEYRQHGHNAVGAKDVRSVAVVLEKIAHPRRFQRMVEEKKAQAAAFAKCFEPELTQEERTLLRDFASRRSPLSFKIRYLRWIHGALRKIGFWVRW